MKFFISVLSVFFIVGPTQALESTPQEDANLFVPYLGCYKYVTFNNAPYKVIWRARLDKKQQSFYYTDLDKNEIVSFAFTLFRPKENNEGNMLDVFDAFQDLGNYFRSGDKVCHEFKGDLLYVGRARSYVNSVICIEPLEMDKVSVQVIRDSPGTFSDSYTYTLKRDVCPKL